jgi:hypothetical protein
VQLAIPAPSPSARSRRPALAAFPRGPVRRSPGVVTQSPPRLGRPNVRAGGCFLRHLPPGLPVVTCPGQPGPAVRPRRQRRTKWESGDRALGEPRPRLPSSIPADGTPDGGMTIPGRDSQKGGPTLVSRRPPRPHLDGRSLTPSAELAHHTPFIARTRFAFS